MIGLLPLLTGLYLIGFYLDIIPSRYPEKVEESKRRFWWLYLIVAPILTVAGWLRIFNVIHF